MQRKVTNKNNPCIMHRTSFLAILNTKRHSKQSSYVKKNFMSNQDVIPTKKPLKDNHPNLKANKEMHQYKQSRNKEFTGEKM